MMAKFELTPERQETEEQIARMPIIMATEAWCRTFIDYGDSPKHLEMLRRMELTLEEACDVSFGMVFDWYTVKSEKFRKEFHKLWKERDRQDLEIVWLKEALQRFEGKENGKE
jgi:hypothetical protein